MPATGRQYGLRVKGKIDDRRDPEKSTRAAARYLRDLAFEFGGDALLLALAGYNRGENGVRRSLKKLRLPDAVGGTQADESYTCPSCSTELFNECPSCHAIRPGLLPFCDHCGASGDSAEA